MSADLAAFLAARSDRCVHGFHLATQHPELCSCTEGGGWATFVRAVKQAADPQGVVSQTRVRPLIASIPAKHRGLMYRRARKAGLLVEAGTEPSTDTAGRNGDKSQRLYKLGVAA